MKFDHDQTDIEPLGDFEALPEGSYIAFIESDEQKRNKADTGDVLSLKWKIADGKYKNRTIFDNLNMKHPNAQAQAISIRTIETIRNIIGIEKLENSSQLHNSPMVIFVTIREYAGKTYNDIKSYNPASEENTQAALDPIGSAGPKPDIFNNE